MGKGRKGKRGRDITEQIFGKRVLAGIASSSHGPDSSAVAVVNRNSGRDTAQTTQDTETAQDRRGMGQELTDNRDGTFLEIAKAGIEKEASSAMPEKEKDTSEMTNLENEEPRNKSCNSREKKASETALHRRETGQEVIENKLPKDGTLPETAKASMGKEASSVLPEKEKDTSYATAVTNLESEEPRCNRGEKKASETALDKRGTGQEVIENKVSTDGTLPETEKGSIGKEASSALLEKEKDTSDATAVTNLESEEPQSKSCNSGEKKASALGRRGTGQKKMRKGRDITEQIFGTRVLAGIASSSRGQDYSAVAVVNRNSGRETAQTTTDSDIAMDRRGMGQELTDNRVPKDGTLPETTKAGMGKEASSTLPEKEKDTSDATAMTNLKSNEPQSRGKKDLETALDTTGTGQKITDNTVAKDVALPETAKASMGKEASSALTIKNEQSEHAESKKTASEDVITLIVPSANPDIRSQPGTGETKNDIVQSVRPPSGPREEIEQANEEIEEANEVITVPSASSDPEIYLLEFGSFRFRPWVPQSDGIEASGSSGERPRDDEQSTEDINRFLYGVSRGFDLRKEINTDNRRIGGWRPQLIE